MVLDSHINNTAEGFSPAIHSSHDESIHYSQYIIRLFCLSQTSRLLFLPLNGESYLILWLSSSSPTWKMLQYNDSILKTYMFRLNRELTKFHNSAEGDWMAIELEQVEKILSRHKNDNLIIVSWYIRTLII